MAYASFRKEFWEPRGERLGPMSLENMNVLSQLCVNTVFSLAWVAVESRAWDKRVHAASLFGGVTPKNGTVE